jgi:hypothetical protein
MEAGTDGSGHASAFKYETPIWGDMITGTKAELQALGLAVGMAFPREEAGPRRELNVRDSRGFPAKIEHDGGGRYRVRIPFPGRSQPREPEIDVAPGVVKSEFCLYDYYVGKSDGLLALGLVSDGQFPGQHGMRRSRVMILADGTVFDGPRGKCDGAGSKSITKLSAGRFGVHVRVGARVEEQRWRLHDLRLHEWQARVSALPRPPSLRRRPEIDIAVFESAVVVARSDEKFQFLLSSMLTVPRRAVAQRNTRGDT